VHTESSFAAAWAVAFAFYIRRWQRDGEVASVHKSLALGTNRVLILCWLVGASGLVLWTSGAVLSACAVGAAFGAVAGVLQGRALRSDPAGFAATATAIDVRRVLSATRDGKLAIAMGWVCGIALLVVSLGTRQVVLAKWLAGYLTFMLLRDVVAYPALRSIAAVSLQPSAGQAGSASG